MTIAANRKISQENRDFYQLGYLNGEDKLKRTINVLETANGLLYKELTRLDRDEPLNGVLLSYKQAVSIIKALKRDASDYHAAKILEAKLKKAKKNDEHAAIMAIKEIME